jgi:beta-mannosidase
VNDSRQDASGKFKVTDVATGKVIFKGKFKVPANSRVTLAELPAPASQGMLLIEYETGGKSYRNHYLYGEPPFDYPTYRNWIEKAGI